jgi:putative FmdB family regulatory protein
MPLYEYECDAGHRFELIRKFSDPPLEECPTCGAPVHKLFSSPAIQFKGSGFYITDYAKKDQTPASPSGESSSDTTSKDKDTGEKSGEKSAEKSGEKSQKTEKTEKGEKTEKAEKGEKGEKASKQDKSSAKTDTPAKAPPAPSKDSS